MRLLLHTEVGQQFGIGFAADQQVMAERAIVAYAHISLAVVAAVVAAEAAGVVVVANVVRVGAPGHLHKREDIVVVYGGEGLCGLVDLCALAAPYCGVLRLIVVFESRNNLPPRFLL